MSVAKHDYSRLLNDDKPEEKSLVVVELSLTFSIDCVKRFAFKK